MSNKTPTYLSDFNEPRPTTPLGPELAAKFAARKEAEDAQNAARLQKSSKEARQPLSLGKRIAVGAVATAAVLSYAHSASDKGTGVNYPSIEDQRKAYEQQPTDQGDHVPQAHVTLPDGAQHTVELAPQVDPNQVNPQP